MHATSARTRRPDGVGEDWERMHPPQRAAGAKVTDYRRAAASTQRAKTSWNGSRA
jgi:hypothetical protein